MGNVSQMVPSLHPVMKLDADATPHTHGFAAAAGGSDIGEWIADAAVALSSIAITVAGEPQLVREIHASFRGAMTRD